MSFLRIGTYEGDPDALEDGFNSQTEALQGLDGFERASFAVDRESRRAVSITQWASREALEASAEAATRMRDEATSPSGATTVDVASYEVVISLD